MVAVEDIGFGTKARTHLAEGRAELRKTGVKAEPGSTGAGEAARCLGRAHRGQRGGGRRRRCSLQGAGISIWARASGAAGASGPDGRSRRADVYS